jgi:hypothetical protein
LVEGQASIACSPGGGDQPLEIGQIPFDVNAVAIRDSRFLSRGLLHRRCFAVVQSRVWLVLDLIEGTGSARLTSLVHLFPSLRAAVVDNQVTVRSRALSLTISFLGSSPGAASVSSGPEGRFAGWYAPDYGIQYAAPVIAVEWEAPEFPWMGGYVVQAGSDACFRLAGLDAENRSISFQMYEKSYTLAIN